MKWLPVNGKKEPQFETNYLLHRKFGEWTKGVLDQINTQKTGKEYTFFDQDGEPLEDVTHFMIIETPKELEQ